MTLKIILSVIKRTTVVPIPYNVLCVWFTFLLLKEKKHYSSDNSFACGTKLVLDVKFYVLGCFVV